jgi:outer membrane protein assembly factor BamB
VVGDRVFIATADGAAQTQSLLCFDRADGRPMWATEVHRGGLMAKQEKNSHASATPVCDGRRVYVTFARAGAIWVSAIDMADGRIAWQTEAGPFSTDWGYGSSPAVYNDLVIVAGDSRRAKLGRLQALAFLAGLDRETGAVVWRIRRPEEHSFGSPVIGRLAGRDQLLLAGHQAVFSYDPATGHEIWHCDWNAVRTANTVAFTDDLVYATTTQPERTIVCIRADGTGDVTDTHVAWRSGKISVDVPSPLAHGDRLFMSTDGGVVTCASAATGKVVWQERCGNAISSSPVWVAGRLYVTAEDGRTTVIKADGPFEVLAKNSLGEDVLSTPVFAGGAVFIRSVQSLWCIGPAQ